MEGRDRQIVIQLAVQAGDLALLQGLDAWLELGLVSENWVRQVCAEQLICPLPEPILEAQPDRPATELQPVGANDFLPPGSDPPQSRSSDRLPGLPARIFQSFMAEISVVWLLFLGVFLVVVSSGVLAATQWRNFSAIGQYAILLGYTLIFWLVSLWTSRQPNLNLTTQTLRIATLLIIPVNFWMMDGFRLWASFSGFVIVAIATLLLTLITFLLLKPSRAGWMTITAIALSWLQWGWSWPGVPFAATYAGTILAALTLLLQEGRGGGGDRGDGEVLNVFPSQPSPSSPASLPYSPLPPLYSLPHLALSFGSLLLLLRAILVAQVPLNQLGLAIGISGWVMVWLSRRRPERGVWRWMGAGLLVLGWAISVLVIPPWQAVVITGLGLWLLGDGLKRTGEAAYLTVGFLVGLQGWWLLWRLIPLPWQQSIIRLCTNLAGIAGMPSALSGLGFFPYVFATIWFAFRLRRWQRPALALQAEQLALGLGILLMLISLSNPTVRSLNLALSTLTLAIVLFSRFQPGAWLIYLTHATALTTLISALDRFFPTLDLHLWATVLVGFMLLEWGGCFLLSKPERFQRNVATNSSPALTDTMNRVSTDPSTPLSTAPLFHPFTSSPWNTSTWHYGLLFAGMSYLLLFLRLWQGDRTWNAVWLITPIALAVLGSQRLFPSARLASWLSTLALFLVQPLMLGSATERLIGVGTATILMLVNTHFLRNRLAAVLTIGFGLSFEVMAFWEVLGDRLLDDGRLPLILAGTILVLWVLRGYLAHRQGVLASLYRRATDGWAISLTVGTLLLLSLVLLLVYLLMTSPAWAYAAASAVLVLATLYRTRQAASNFTTLALAWSMELLVAATLALPGPPTRLTVDRLAIANLTLAIITLLLGNWLIFKNFCPSANQFRTDAINRVSTCPSSSPLPHPPFTWHLIPLLYALLAIALQPFFTTTSAIYTFIAALVGIGVGRRLPVLNPLTFLSVLAASLAANEFLVTQLRQVQGGNPNDLAVMLALLAAVLAIATLLTQRWAIPFLRFIKGEWLLIGNLHWGLGNLWLILGLTLSLSPTASWLWLGSSILLAAYGLAKAHPRWARFLSPPSSLSSSSPPSPPLLPAGSWVYAGITQSLIAIAYALQKLIPETTLTNWAGAIAVGIAVGLYFGPWQFWGWPQRPWRQVAAVVPGIAVVLVAWWTNIQSLLMAAAFYAWLAAAERRPRWSYVGVLLANWAVLRIFVTYGLREPLWFVIVLSASLLYVAQIDPALQGQGDREKRHWLRSLATALVCLTGFYQAEVGIAGVAPVLAGLLALALDFGFILAGLLLRVRAFLFIGTVTFILQVLWQLWRFMSDYSFMLWTLGILLGLLLIWVAATFEARRSQVNILVQRWASQLEQWE